ncbi:uncharacterized protein TNCV_4696981 [Trichonephila clavipes]|nr:uncharacterized protein TNCV_4696981 [Trichonephila clavipes]
MFMKLKCPDCDKKKLGNKVEFFYVLNLTCSSGAEKVCAVETSNESQAYGIAAETLQSEVHSEVSKSYEAPTDVPVVDISVSFDGSWLTRGHTSLIGIVGVIDILTGYVIDFEVMCKENPEGPELANVTKMVAKVAKLAANLVTKYDADLALSPRSR